MTFHVANYEIVMAPAGTVVLAVLFAIALYGAVAVVRAIRGKGRP
jgi:uncharacterized membrane protein YiaA